MTPNIQPPQANKILMKMIATCPDETKEVLAEELRQLGATNIALDYRAVSFECDARTFYEIHLKVRTASRLLRVIKDVAAKTPQMLEAQARRLPWPDLFDVSHSYLVEGIITERGPEFMKANDVSKCVRLGIEDAFQRHVGRLPKVDLKEPKVVVVAFVRKGRCILSFDTSGKALHKRGYREDGHPAPIKETLAAAILQLAGYNGSEPFLDPMCGSGTIAIEAAMLALRKAPQIHRKKGQFGFEWLKDLDRELWRQVQDQVRAERLAAPVHPVSASDLETKYVDSARRHALKARVERDIQFNSGRFQDLEAPGPEGLVVMNLPYGERLGKDDDMEKLYREVGDTLKQKFSGWRAAILAAVDSPYKLIGLKPKRRIPLMNGSIECRLLIFELYAGSRKAAKAPADDAAPASS